MEQKRYNRISWLSEAVSQVRFGPDREAVTKELIDHIEDKRADLMRIFPDMSKSEAEERVMAQMGDPKEIGTELGRIHKPWLGYIWKASGIVLKVVIAALVVVLLNRVVFHDGMQRVDRLAETWRENRESRVIAQVLYEDTPTTELEAFAENGEYFWKGVARLTYYPIGSEQRLGEATVSFTDAALWQTETAPVLYVRVRVAYDDIRDKSEYLPLYLQAEDDLGNRYGHQIRHYEREDGGSGTSLRGFGSFGEESFWDGYAWNLILEVPEEAEQVRFTYALRTASDFEFVLNLKEAAG